MQITEFTGSILCGAWVDLRVGDTWDHGEANSIVVTRVEPVPADEVFTQPTQRVYGRIGAGKKVLRWTFPADMSITILRPPC